MRKPRACTCTDWGRSRPSTTRTSRPAGLAGRRSLFVDLPGHGISDRPEHFGYTLEEHADALASALDTAGLTGVELIAHSMGGAVAVVLAHRRPELVSRLVLTEANLDAFPPPTAGSSGIASYEEDAFVDSGYARVLEKVGPVWAATMRLADPLALHRTAVGLRRGSRPVMRTILEGLPSTASTFRASSAVNSKAGRRWRPRTCVS